MEIIRKLEVFMTANLPYLDHRYSIHDLSKDIRLPVYQLSLS